MEPVIPPPLFSTADRDAEYDGELLHSSPTAKPLLPEQQRAAAALLQVAVLAPCQPFLLMHEERSDDGSIVAQQPGPEEAMSVRGLSRPALPPMRRSGSRASCAAPDSRRRSPRCELLQTNASAGT